MTAMVTAAFVGAAGSFISSKKASKAAGKAGDQAAAADAARLDFEREQWDEWQSTYGPIEDSLAAYYEQLTPSYRATQGLEAHEKEMNRARKNLDENLAQRGIATSGIAGQVQTELAVSSANERARIRAAAPLEVAKEKLGFLQVGLGMNPQQGTRDALTDQSTNADRTARETARNAGVASGAMIGSFTDLAQAGFTAWMNRGNQNTTPLPKPGAP
jgi:hypothetical protein